MLMCTLFKGRGGGGSEKVYVLYTHLNVDNYGRPLKGKVKWDIEERCKGRHLYLVSPTTKIQQIVVYQSNAFNMACLVS